MEGGLVTGRCAQDFTSQRQQAGWRIRPKRPERRNAVTCPNEYPRRAGLDRGVNPVTNPRARSGAGKGGGCPLVQNAQLPAVAPTCAARTHTKNMTAPTELLLGQPTFDPATTADALAPWRAALAEGRDAALRLAARAKGSFAVGVQDPATGRSFLAVDRFAAHTLCYRVHQGRLEFAARADAWPAAAELDAQAVFDYLFFHCIPSPRTIFKGVMRLPPGHCAWFEGGQLTVAPFWVATFSEPQAAPPFDALRDQFRNTLRDAVKQRLDGGQPACFLSGGTDSSTVAGMIGLAGGEPAHTYSIGFEAEGYDEMAFARIAAKHFKTKHTEYYVTPDDLVRSIGAVAQSYDQPFGNSSALPAYYCAKVAREQGVTRILAGDDELFGGNSRYAKQRVFGWYQNVPGFLRTGLMEPLLERTPLGALPGLKKGRSYIEQAKIPMPDRLQIYNLLLRLGTADVLTPAFLAQVDQGAPARLQREVWGMARDARELNRTLAFDWRFTLAESDLPKVRGTTQLAGVDVAFPFLDDALLDFSLRLPESYKLRGMKLRWFFKEALRGFLPDEIITKKKQGFGLPFGVWANRHAPLKALALESLNSLAGRGIVRPQFIRTLVEQRLPEHPGYYGEMVWILMMLEQWLQSHLPNTRLGA
jgi:asparagine synthase (glutamine-hydrolysing)